MSNKKCNHKNQTGYVTNQPDGYDPNRSHASTTVCDREECRENATRWVEQETGESGVYRDFGPLA